MIKAQIGGEPLHNSASIYSSSDAVLETAGQLVGR